MCYEIDFNGIPHSMLRSLLSYKCMVAGITYIEQEESYTSKADITAKDYIPTYGKDDWRGRFFSGERVKRGLYLCGSGLLINADCNGAANILRKAVPDAWDNVRDFSFLSRPEKVSFKDLNKRRKAA